MFSRNAASSRAIPFEKMVKMIKEDPFIPIAWQKDHKGMQGTEYIDPYTNDECFPIGDWLEARDCAVKIAQEMSADKITKQICNRLIEPFMWYTVLVTATEYDNFFELRCPKYIYKGRSFKSKKDLLKANLGSFPNRLDDIQWLQFSQSGAEIHIQALAEAMWDARNESAPKQLKAGEWHIPFGDKIDVEKLANLNPNGKDVIKVAVARCARLSYMTFDGEIDYEKDIKLHDQLLSSKHMSPFEHVAKCMSNEEYQCFIKGYPIIGNEALANSVDANGNLFMNWLPTDKNEPNIHMGIREGWCNNFRGFIPYRYLIENE